ncbi:1,2-phenylacetyl-CoA epoxidase subunit PaaD [Chromobacterium alticapitis]|uniref:1,2-phenylacetyl-CoA epoxidase subunit PaaD n=1 Tax=Chromobacterium alticapitis TaxID=2073169 RepID=UPI0018EA73AF|nr:1,2-phenylacetyl-CoA epoxidase subunit PaaD [Chromobacterium alticapitis]
MTRIHGFEVRPGTERIWEWLAGIPDPEMPYISIVDLGIVRDVRWHHDALNVVVTPTYSGCPARQQIEQNIVNTLLDRGVDPIRLETRLHPAWTTDWISAEGKSRMRAAGVAPPLSAPQGWQTLRFRPREDAAPRPDCPHCGSGRTRLHNEFAGTTCKALYLCDACSNPFEHFKSI